MTRKNMASFVHRAKVLDFRMTLGRLNSIVNTARFRACGYCTICPRVNEINIQLISESLHRQIFQPNSDGGTHEGRSTEVVVTETGQEVPVKQEKTMEVSKLAKVQKHLEQHDLWKRNTNIQPNVELNLPPFLGKNIDEHFSTLARRQVQDYVELAQKLVKCQIPEQPKKWAWAVGWTRYNPDGTTTAVGYPDDKAVVFDVETVVMEGCYPAMATAVSDKHWYSWASEHLVQDKFRWSHEVHIDDLIPMETAPGSGRTESGDVHLVVGHNVSFDRSYVKEQYNIRKSRLRFMDTMSMHIAVCGLTNFQRVLFKADQNNSNQKVVKEFRERQKIRGTILNEDWKDISTLNNLRDVHRLHVGGKPIEKDSRKIFEEGSTADIRDNFQELMRYCANDSTATLEVFKVLWPEFNERFPHPVTLAGMLEMGTGYLPVNENWERYIHQSNTVYQDMQRESKQLLMKLANEACAYLHDNRYKQDPWLWDLDWTTKDLKLKKVKPPPKKKKGSKVEEPVEEAKEEEAEDVLKKVLEQQERHYKTTSTLLNYPEWYRLLCPKVTSEDWSPGPSNISYQTRVTPKLLRLTWDGFPVHFDDTHGWGYLVPGRTDNLGPDTTDDQEPALERLYPYRELCKILNLPDSEGIVAMETEDGEEPFVLPLEALTDEQFEEMMNARLSYDDIHIGEIKKYFDQTDVVVGRNKKRQKKDEK